MDAKELIAALEKAEGPSRELDAWIYVWCGGPDDEWAARTLIADVISKGGTITDLKPYTASLDAAMSLVPEGWTRAVDATAPELVITVCLYAPSSMGRAPDVKADHKSEAVATIISALRARQA